MGIYRLSGTTSKVQKLKAALDAGKQRTSTCWTVSHSAELEMWVFA